MDRNKEGTGMAEVHYKTMKTIEWSGKRKGVKRRMGVQVPQDREQIVE